MFQVIVLLEDPPIFSVLAEGPEMHVKHIKRRITTTVVTFSPALYTSTVLSGCLLAEPLGLVVGEVGMKEIANHRRGCRCSNISLSNMQINLFI